MGAMAEQGEQGGGSSGGAVRVVVADDQAAFREVACGVIAETSGLELVAATDRVHRLPELVRDADALLLDVRMPGEDSLGMALRLRDLQPQLRVLLVSAESLEDIPDEVFDRGIGFLAKEDLSPAALRAAIGVGVT